VSTPRAAIILPARYHSTRFPGKPLSIIAGKPLIEWVYQRAAEVRGVSRLLVATDHKDIAETVRAFGGEVVMSGEHETGTDRVAAIAREFAEEIIVNLQGDEPLFPPSLVEEMIALITRSDETSIDSRDPSPASLGYPPPAGDPRSLLRKGRYDQQTSHPTDIVTACHAITSDDEINDPNVVKVVKDRNGRALYFSRAAIPFVKGDSATTRYRHVGIYVFKKESLIRFAELEPTPLEKSENLEQLRALENGMSIRLVETEYSTVGVDVPEDIKSVEKLLTTAYSL